MHLLNITLFKAMGVNSVTLFRCHKLRNLCVDLFFLWALHILSDEHFYAFLICYLFKDLIPMYISMQNFWIVIIIKLICHKISILKIIIFSRSSMCLIRLYVVCFKYLPHMSMNQIHSQFKISMYSNYQVLFSMKGNYCVRFRC